MFTAQDVLADVHREIKKPIWASRRAYYERILARSAWPPMIDKEIARCAEDAEWQEADMRAHVYVLVMSSLNSLWWFSRHTEGAR